MEGSGFIISRVNCFYINYCAYVTLNGIGSYVPYPRGLRGKDEIFNSEASCVIQCIAAYQLHRRGKAWKNILRIVKSLAGCKGCVKNDGIKSPVRWESLAQIE